MRVNFSAISPNAAHVFVFPMEILMTNGIYVELLVKLHLMQCIAINIFAANGENKRWRRNVIQIYRHLFQWKILFPIQRMTPNRWRNIDFMHCLFEMLLAFHSVYKTFAFLTSLEMQTINRYIALYRGKSAKIVELASALYLNKIET